MTHKHPSTQLSIPLDLRKWISKSADKNRRTFEDEIIHHLALAHADSEKPRMPIDFDDVDPNASFDELKRYTQRLAREVDEILRRCEKGD
ncbi:hypothetical protein N5W20_06665 [Candidatus Kirkpatrickella diaphorinae]|uniref:Arc-like DNA binding domain-containing protein n=1 Tax=Candidatus Kirkpatrickella diaphorinae TaxID=2984322 RepID=A0ABY6GH09_9PROT|nr:hypothetical protein [Candidatus Kirkpatrickella diaphorinae]UYH50792.1 hypothetical protein N5W20_06665 [Candidatus Kirkpatrickella diaphorinae]